MANGIIITITGTSGIGKGYLKDHLKKSFNLKEPPVYTTRARREGETRPDRVFVNPAEFETLFKSGKLVFSQDLYGDRYAFDKSAFLRGGIITEVHAGIAEEFRKLFPNSIMIALTTDSIDFLRYRLKKRGDSPEQINKRIKAAKAELALTTKLSKVFDVNYSVGYHNENSIVADIRKQILKLAQTRKQLLKKRTVKLNSMAKLSRSKKKRGKIVARKK